MPLSRNQSKSAENLCCQRNLLTYFQLTRSVLRYLIVKITLVFDAVPICSVADLGLCTEQLLEYRLTDYWLLHLLA